MNRTELKQKIKDNVYQNAFGEISGDNLQRVLLDMVDYSNKANDENFEKEEIVIVNPQGYYVPSGVKINDIGSNLTAGENIKIEDNTISAIGYKYNEDKNSISIGGGEITIPGSADLGIPDTVVEGTTNAVGINSIAGGFNSIALGDNSVAIGGGFVSASIGTSGAIIPNVTIAKGNCSHAEGIGTFASGEGSYAEGIGDTKIVNFTVNKMTQEIADVLINDPQFSGSLGVENTYYSTDESVMQGTGSIIPYSSGLCGVYRYNESSQPLSNYIGSATIGRTVTYNDEPMFVFALSGSVGVIDDNEKISWLNTNGGVASGYASHAEGNNTKAYGSYSHAEGSYTITFGWASHAEGSNTRAQGDYSHAEGSACIATGRAAHAEGCSGTIASGQASHAEGQHTTAAGYASHAEGDGTIAYGNSSHAEGSYGSMNTFPQQEQIYEWDEEGNENIYYVNNYNWEEGTNIINCVNLSLYYFNVRDVLIIEKYDEWDNLIEGPITTNIVNLDYENNQIEIDNYLYFDAQYTQLVSIRYAATGSCSHREGACTTASGSYSHAEGDYTTASGFSSHAEGHCTIANNEAEHAEGKFNKSNTNTISSIGIGTGYDDRKNAFEVTNDGNIYMFGAGNYDGTNPEDATTVQELLNSISGGGESYTAGTNIDIVNNTISAKGYVYNEEKNSFATGSGTVASSDASHAEGFETTASSSYSHSEGYYTKAESYASHAEGCCTKTEGYYSHAEGYYTIASGQASHAEGGSSGSGAIPVIAAGWSSHAEGIATTALGDASHAEGIRTKTEGYGSHSEGYNTIAKNRYEHAEGSYNVSNKVILEEGEPEEYGDALNTQHSIGIGYWDSIANEEVRKNAFEVMQNGDQYIIGIGGYDGTNPAEAQTLQQVINNGGGTGGASYTAGANIEIENNIISAIGYRYDKENLSFAEGQYTTASGYASHAEGSSTITFGMYSHAEGFSTNASGDNSHTEGSATIGIGSASHAEGRYTTAQGMASHAEGSDTIAYGDYSHAEGYMTGATGEASHTEGSYTTASGYCSHAGGYNCQANGTKSFVHGNNCIVDTNGENAHTIGIDNYVSNSGCIALGKGLTSHREYCTYLGQYNKQLPGDWNDVIAVVGDGTDSSNKRNIVVIQSGNEPAVHCRGAFKNDATWINDFGEYFEWADGNPNNEDRVGYMVQLNENQIELAQSIDEFIGVISATAGFIGGACSLDWHGIYLRDVFGRYITDENGNPVINPEYDENKPYIPREKRPEWDIVGLLGQVVVRQDGTLKVGKYIDCKNGIATYADSGKYKVLKVINNDVALILIK